jgi:hypothetical protein
LRRGCKIFTIQTGAIAGLKRASEAILTKEVGGAIGLNAYSVLILKSEGKKRLGARKVKKKNRNKVVLKEIGYKNAE